MVVTDDVELYNTMLSIRSHGWSRDRNDSKEWLNKKSGNDAKFLFVSTGFNIRPMEIQAAIGSSQLNDIEEFIEKRRYIAQRVKLAISGSGLKLIGSETLESFKTKKHHSWMLLPLLVLGENSEERKNKIVQELEELEIETKFVVR